MEFVGVWANVKMELKDWMITHPCIVSDENRTVELLVSICLFIH